MLLVRARLARTDFFLESSLQLLTLSLERDPASGAALLQCTAQFADRLPPLSLFSSSSGVIDRSLRALIDWLTSQAAAPGTDHSDHAALTILIKLVLARGTLTALLHLAEFLCAKPELLAQGSALSELQKLCDVESFEESARANFFGPAPGSASQLLEVWERQVFPTVAKEKSEDAPGILEKLGELLGAGDADGARSMVRGLLSEEALAKLEMPRLENLSSSESSVEYKQAAERLERFAAAQSHSVVSVLGVLLGSADLLSRRVRAGRHGSAAFRVPAVSDGEAMHGLVKQLRAVFCEQELAWTDSGSEDARAVAGMLLRLLKANLEALAAERRSMAEPQASELRQLLEDCLAVDVQQHPHCLPCCRHQP